MSDIISASATTADKNRVIALYSELNAELKDIADYFLHLETGDKLSNAKTKNMRLTGAFIKWVEKYADELEWYLDGAKSNITRAPYGYHLSYPTTDKKPVFIEINPLYYVDVNMFEDDGYIYEEYSHIRWIEPANMYAPKNYNFVRRIEIRVKK